MQHDDAVWHDPCQLPLILILCHCSLAISLNMSLSLSISLTISLSLSRTLTDSFQVAAAALNTSWLSCIKKFPKTILEKSGGNF